MCGRAAQTVTAVQSAYQWLVPEGGRGMESTRPVTGEGGSAVQSNHENPSSRSGRSDESSGCTTSCGGATAGNPISNQHSGHHYETKEGLSEEIPVLHGRTRDNYNLSPGMDATVFWRDNHGTIQSKQMVWGLVTRRGTSTMPLPTGMNQHFANMMFNARSDTLYEKVTYQKLTTARKSCLVALDGFFEWKTELGTKVPYFVYRPTTGVEATSHGVTVANSSNDHCNNQASMPLIMAGLWTSVPTGRVEDPLLETFTIITQDACPTLRWLHHRMPLCVWEVDHARQWLEQPSSATVLHQLVEYNTKHGIWKWHGVTTNMSSPKFRSIQAIQPLPPANTVKSYFAVLPKGEKVTTTFNREKGVDSQKQPNNTTQDVGSVDTDTASKKKRPISKLSSSPAQSNKKGKNNMNKPKSTPGKQSGTILAYFSPKK